MSNNLKNHNFKAVLTIHQINISVKFPCTVSTGIKSDSKQFELPKEFQLINGNAHVNESLPLDIKMTYNSKNDQYSEKKICIVVYLKSSSGKIPAGSANIIIKSKQQQKNVKVGIQKCPDKSANIQYSLKLNFVSDEEYFEEPRGSKSTTNLHLLAENKHYSKEDKKYNIRTEVFGSGSRVSVINKNYTQDDRSEKSQGGSQSRISKMIMKEHENQVNSQRHKILELQKQKTRAQKQIRALKHEIETNSLKNSGISERQDNYVSAKRQSRISFLEDEIEKEKNKTSEFSNEIHRKKLRIQQVQRDLQSMHKKNEEMDTELKGMILQKQKMAIKNKELLFDLKQIKQKYEDQVLMHENYLKRIQFKQNVYKQQLKTLNDKYTASESEKQKLLFQKNQLINEYEEKDRREKESNRVKERAATEEKNRLMRNIDLLQKELSVRKQEKQAIDQQFMEMEVNNKKMKAIIDNFEVIQQNSKRQISQLKNQLIKQSGVKKNLDDKIEGLQKLIQEKKVLKRSLNEKQQQFLHQSKTMAVLENSKKALMQKVEQLELALKQKNGGYKILQKQLQNSNKKLEALKKSQAQKAQQLADITFMKQKDESRMMGLSEEMKEVDKKYKQVEIEYKKQIQNLTNKINECEEDNHEMNEKNFLLTQQMHQMQKDLNQLKIAFQSKLTHIDKLQSALSSNEIEKEERINQINSLIHLKEDIQQEYSHKFSQLQKEKEELQKDKRDCEIRLQKLSRDSELGNVKVGNQLKQLQGDVKNKDKQLHRLQGLLDDLQNKLSNSIFTIESLQQEVSSKMREIEFLKDSIQKQRKQNEELQIELKQAQFEIQTQRNQLKLTADNLESENKQKQEINTDAKRAKKQLEKFRANNLYSLKSYFTLLSQVELPDIININHDEEDILKGMTESIKRRKSLDNEIRQLRALNMELKEEINDLKEEVIRNEKDFDRLGKEIGNLSEGKSSVQKQLEKVRVVNEEVIENLRQKIADLNKKIEGLQMKGGDMGEAIAKKNEEIASLKGNNEREVKQLRRKIEELQGKLKENSKKCEQNEQDIVNKANKAIDELKIQISALQQQLRQQQIQHKSVVLKNQQQSFENIEKIQKKAAIAQQQSNRLQIQVQAHVKAIQKLQLQLQNKEDEIKNRVSKTTSVQKQIQNHLQESKGLKQKILNLETTNSGLSGKLEKCQERIKQLTKDRGEIERSLSEENKRIENELKKTVANLEREIKIKQNLQAKIIEMEERGRSLESRIGENLKEIENLKKNLNILGNESTGEKQRYIKQNEALIKRVEKLSKDSQQQIEYLRREMEQMKAQRDFLRQSNTNLQKNMEIIIQQKSSQGGQSLRRIAQLQKENESVNMQLQKSNQQIRNLQNNLTELSRTFQSYQNQNNNQVTYMQPILDKLAMLLAESQEYNTFMSQFQASKSKLIKISNLKIEDYSEKYLGEAVREINMAAQKCKVQIINKLKISQEEKVGIVEEFKKLQIAIEKVSRN